MAANDINTAPIIKKIKKGGHAAHHGGSWKVAYADFVTAMMALFLLLWILETTTMEQRKAISDLFQNPSVIMGPGGASTAIIDLGGAMDAPRGEGGEIMARNPQEKPSEEEIMEEAREIKQFEELKLILEETIDSNPVLKEFKDQILIDIVDDGLRLQIIDQDKRPMFAKGSNKLQPYSQEVLHEIAKVIDELPNPISITGHTDGARVYQDDGQFTNWELSSARANAARYELVRGGYSPSKIARVIGLADTVPLNRAEPMAPVNRRIALVVLNKKALEAMKKGPSLTLEKDKGTEFTRNLPNVLDDIERQMNAFPEKKPAPAKPQTPAPKPPPQGSTAPQPQAPQRAASGPIAPPIPVQAPATAKSPPPPPAQTVQLQDGSEVQADQLEQDLDTLLRAR